VQLFARIAAAEVNEADVSDATQPNNEILQADQRFMDVCEFSWRLVGLSYQFLAKTKSMQSLAPKVES
jgi:hypothetical protein